MTTDTTALVPAGAPAALAVAGQVANAAAADGLFTDYRERKAPNTLRRQDAELARFADFLAAAAIPDAPTPQALARDPAAWRGLTWGLVAAFVRWLLGRGYAVGTVNLALSTVKTYAGLAANAGVIPPGELVLLRAVKGYGRTEGQWLDDGRPVTRTGGKKRRRSP